MANKTLPELERIATRQSTDLFVFHRSGVEYSQTREKMLEEYVAPTYSVYVALLTQTGTDNPTATILNSGDSNYLGEIVWARTGMGIYVGTLASAFTSAKTECWLSMGGGYTGYIDVTSTSVVTLNTLLGLSTDGALINTPVRIYVHD